MWAYAVSALWRHPYEPAIYGGYFGAVFLTGFAASLMVPLIGLAVIVGGLFVGGVAMSWEGVAQTLSRQRGFRVLYVLPSPARWVARRLRALGYVGPVAPRLWEMHVNEAVRWHHGPDPHDAVRRFRAAYTADRLRWLAERPDDVGLVICTFNRLPAAEVAALQAAGGWVYAGPLDARIPRVVTPRRQRNTQRRMFGAVVSRRDRTDPTAWTTVYVPPRMPHSSHLRPIPRCPIGGGPDAKLGGDYSVAELNPF